MILSMVFLFLMLLLITALLFYLFCFFLPALKLKYDGISAQLASELRFADDTNDNLPDPDYSKVAVVEKSEENIPSEKRLNYLGEKNCWLFHSAYTSEYKNPKICIGFGDCVKVCPQEAIKIINNRAVVGQDCNGCGKCIDYCPEKLISLVDAGTKNDAKKSEKDSSKGFKFWGICYKIISVGMRGQ
ncbi:MAG: 4Fe-4S dicluster domain-containing protein [Treponema sp.]|nr:4Fe-4S dicluster domain-containing protein [Treponema sp.]